MKQHYIQKIVIIILLHQNLISRFSKNHFNKLTCEEAIQTVNGIECVLSPSLLKNSNEAIYLIRSTIHDKLMSMIVYDRSNHFSEQIAVFGQMKNIENLPDIEQLILTKKFILILVEHSSLRYLSSRIEIFQNPTSLTERLEFFLSLLKAVENLHQIGYVHGNLNPNNILLDCDSNPIVSGFSNLRKIGDQRVPEGDFQYMSPELLMAKKENIKITVDASQDIFALGLIYYQLVNQHLPYKIPKNLDNFHLKKMKILLKKEQQMENVLILRYMLNLEFERLNMEDLIDMIQVFLRKPTNRFNPENILFKVAESNSLDRIPISHFVKVTPSGFENISICKIIFISVFVLIILLVGIFIYCLLRSKNRKIKRQSTDMSVYFSKNFLSNYNSEDLESGLGL